MIEIKSVKKNYGNYTAIEDISFTVENGSVTGIAGYNGAGKTTLLRVCAGVFKPEYGEVLIDGENVFDNDSNRKKLFYLADEMWFPGGATVAGAARYYSRYYPDFDFEVFEKVCACFKLDKKKRIKSLSKGMTKQASLAIAFGAKPKYLLIDETFDGLDPEKKSILKKLMLEFISHTDVSVLITSHDLNEIAEVCDRIVLINGKRVQLCCDIGDVSSNFRRAVLAFDRAISDSDFDTVNHRRLRISGKTASLLIYGDIEAEKSKIAQLGPISADYRELALEEVFEAELDPEADGLAVSGVFEDDKNEVTE